MEEETTNLTLLIENAWEMTCGFFPDEEGVVHVPEKCFKDFFGLGLMGDVYEMRSRISSPSVGNCEVKNITGYSLGSSTVGNLNCFEYRDKYC